MEDCDNISEAILQTGKITHFFSFVIKVDEQVLKHCQRWGEMKPGRGGVWKTGAGQNYDASQAFHSTRNFIFLSSRAIVTVLSTVD